MTEREKVIKGLECSIGIRGCKNCDDCPYDNDFNCIGCDIVLRDAIVLLKEQEPRVLKLEQEPIKVERHMEETEWNVCGNCGSHVIHKWAYCPYCGKRLKWDD